MYASSKDGVSLLRISFLLSRHGYVSGQRKQENGVSDQISERTFP